MVKPFYFKWKHFPDTVFPAVEIEANSYYEALAKILQKLEEVINLVNEIEKNTNDFMDKMTNAFNELYAAWAALQKWVSDYFKNLDVQEEINNKLDSMAADGSLLKVMIPHIDPLLEEYWQQLLIKQQAFETKINGVMDTQNTNINDLKTNIANLSSDINTINQEITTINQAFNTLTTDYNTFKQSVETNIDSILSRLDTAETNINSINKILNNIKRLKIYGSETEMIADAANISVGDILFIVNENYGDLASFTVINNPTSATRYHVVLSASPPKIAVMTNKIIFASMCPQIKAGDDITYIVANCEEFILDKIYNPHVFIYFYSGDLKINVTGIDYYNPIVDLKIDKTLNKGFSKIFKNVAVQFLEFTSGVTVYDFIFNNCLVSFNPPVSIQNTLFDHCLFHFKTGSILRHCKMVQCMLWHYDPFNEFDAYDSSLEIIVDVEEQYQVNSIDLVIMARQCEIHLYRTRTESVIPVVTFATNTSSTIVFCYPPASQLALSFNSNTQGLVFSSPRTLPSGWDLINIH